MKFTDILGKISSKKYKPLPEAVTAWMGPADMMASINNGGVLAEIYDFACKTTANAENLFNLTHEEGDLVYYSLLTALKHLKNYPEE